MKRRIKRWLGIGLLLKRLVVLELAAKEAKDRFACQAKLIASLEERIAELEQKPAQEKPKPVQIKSWQAARQLLERESANG